MLLLLWALANGRRASGCIASLWLRPPNQCVSSSGKKKKKKKSKIILRLGSNFFFKSLIFIKQCFCILFCEGSTCLARTSTVSGFSLLDAHNQTPILRLLWHSTKTVTMAMSGTMARSTWIWRRRRWSVAINKFIILIIDSPTKFNWLRIDHSDKNGTNNGLHLSRSCNWRDKPKSRTNTLLWFVL